MSEVFPLIDGFVGYGDGLEAQLHSDEPWDTEHPLYAARPDLFTEPLAPPVTEPPPAAADPAAPSGPPPAATAPPAKVARASRKGTAVPDA